jgi:hypothetical protein
MVESLAQGLGPDGEPRVELKEDKLTVTAQKAGHERVQEFLTVCQKGLTAAQWRDVLPGPPRLLTVVPKAEFNGAPLEQVVEHIRKATGQNLAVDWKELGSAGIDRGTKVTLRMREVDGLKLLMTVLPGLEVAAGKARLEPVFILGGQVCLITTEAGAQKQMRLAAFELMGKSQGRQATLADVTALMEQIRKTVAPASWQGAAQGKGLLLEAGPRRLMCCQSAAKIRATAELIDKAWGLADRRPMERPQAGPSSDNPPRANDTGAGPTTTTRPTAGADDELRARNLLQLADNLMEAGKHEAARERYMEILKRYPGSKAAEAAKEKLGPMK